MVTATTDSIKSAQDSAHKASPKTRSNGAKSANAGGKVKAKPAAKRKKSKSSIPEVPSWVGIAASVVGAGVAAGLFAWKHYQNNAGSHDGFNAAFADGETDEENFDQTRNAGASSTRTDANDWEEVDDMSDASFPASDPPSFNPGTA